MPMRDQILIIDDEPNLRTILHETLTRQGYDVLSFAGWDEAKPALQTESIDVVITDLQMPDASGMDVLAYCKRYAPDLPVILITAYGTIERAVAAMREGAFDFVLKPFQNEELFRILRKASESRIRRNREPGSGLMGKSGAEWMSASGVGPVPIPLFGKSPEAASLRAEVERASRSEAPVLMTGPAGTGARSLAHEIHRKSVRAREPFLQLNCAAVPAVFQPTELFGVEKGAGPMHWFSKPGALELAQTGTLFLEEVDALSVEAQNQLFTALENESFVRVGGVRGIPAGARIIATSVRDVGVLARDGAFHVELFYKLSALPVLLKPLKDRKDDLRTDFIPYFLERASCKRGIPAVACSEDAMSWLLAQEWPGNLGELERAIQQAVGRCEGGVIERTDFREGR